MKLGGVGSVFEKRINAVCFTLWQLEELGHLRDKSEDLNNTSLKFVKYLKLVLSW
jgi:hypothetical protein